MPVESIPETVQAQIKICCEALDDKKALDIKILHVAGKSSITDFFIIATGNSDPHLRALRGSVEAALKKDKIPIVGTEASPDSGWSVIDAFDFMVHIFLPEMRESYALDALWKDADEVELSIFLGSA